ncbi:MAG: hypothetical protein IPK17_20025 [Chloroflexi bacterium]|uniref:hypothetical protein n=1 Tax=Candidatus Flexifilum breve TaxID=3140694 RepID=UPI0031355D03|nr:hypothetical protein [Chloroflexota bacterium]
MEIIFRLFIILATLVFAGGVAAQDTGSVGYAGVKDNTLILYQADGSSIRVDNPENQGLTHLAWSPDGSKLAYVLIDAEYDWHLMVVNADGTNPEMLANTGRVEASYPISWTSNQQILFAQPPQTFDSEQYLITLAVIAPEATAPATLLGQVPVGVGCGGGSPLPADWQYWTETGFGGSPMTLQWTDFGVLYSVTCGGTGYALLDPATGEPRYVTPVSFYNGIPGADDNISRAKLSPDGTTLVAIRTVYAEPDPVESVVLVDLATGTITDVPTSMQPDQVAWSASGDVYYAARSVADPDLLDDLTPEQRARLEALGTGFVIGSNMVTIAQVNVQTHTETVIHTASAHYVGRLVEAPDGSLWFSLIPNMQAWLQGIGDGTIDPLNDVDNRQQLATVPVSVYRAAGGQIETIVENFNQFTLRPA